MASYSDHDDHLSFSPSRTPESAKVKFLSLDDQFAQDHVNQLVGYEGDLSVWHPLGEGRVSTTALDLDVLF